MKKEYGFTENQIELNIPLIANMLKCKKCVQLRLTNTGRLKIGCYVFENVRPVDGSLFESTERQGRA